MAHAVDGYDDGEPPIRRLPPERALRPWFSLAEMLIVLAIASVLMLIGTPALLNILAHYKTHAAAQQLVMLGRQARLEAIKLNQPVTIVGDANRNAFYVFSGTLPTMPPYSLPDGVGDIPADQRVAVWELPKGLAFSILPICPVRYCQAFSFNPDGSATGPAPPAPPGQSVTFTTPQALSSKVSMAYLATGKLVIQ
jgi:prepilin-type N-terminal cleavage/methylation domain-containing protein